MDNMNNINNTTLPNEQKKKSTTLIIVIISLIIVGLVSYIVYDKVLLNTETNEKDSSKEEEKEKEEKSSATAISNFTASYDEAYGIKNDGTVKKITEKSTQKIKNFLLTSYGNIVYFINEKCELIAVDASKDNYNSEKILTMPQSSDCANFTPWSLQATNSNVYIYYKDAIYSYNLATKKEKLEIDDIHNVLFHVTSDDNYLFYNDKNRETIKYNLKTTQKEKIIDNFIVRLGNDNAVVLESINDPYSYSIYNIKTKKIVSIKANLIRAEFFNNTIVYFEDNSLKQLTYDGEISTLNYFGEKMDTEFAIYPLKDKIIVSGAIDLGPVECDDVCGGNYELHKYIYDTVTKEVTEWNSEYYK